MGEKSSGPRASRKTLYNFLGLACLLFFCGVFVVRKSPEPIQIDQNVNPNAAAIFATMSGLRMNTANYIHNITDGTRFHYNSDNGGNSYTGQILDQLKKYTEDLKNTLNTDQEEIIIETNNLISEEKVIQLVSSLYSKLSQSLLWAAVSTKETIVWSRISNSDVHILNSLARYLKPIVENVISKANDNPTSSTIEEIEKLQKLMTEGYQCTNLQAKQQEVISSVIKFDICSEIEWYKVIHLAWPEATTFLDIGANKGYLGSLFVGLWGGGGLGISPKKIFDLSKARHLWDASRNPAGYCKDGWDHALPLYCTPKMRNSDNGECNDRNEAVSVYSIDGSSYLTGVLNKVITEEFSYPTVKAGKNWKYFNYAMSNKKGVARFTKQSKTVNPGFEGGHISSGVSDTTEEVEMMTVESFLEMKGIKKIDILKIDTEGNDNKVIIGASTAIRETLGVFTFEAGRGVNFDADMIKELDSIGYSCYSTTKAGMFKFNGGCMTDDFINKKNDKGNVFCANRIRVPQVTLALDILSFPALIDATFNNDPLKKESLELSLLSKIYINIKPFCSPFPSCISEV